MSGLVYTKDLFDGAVTVWVFGAYRHWGYKGSSSVEIDQNNPGIVLDLQSIFSKLRMDRVVSPVPAFNARVVGEGDLKDEVMVGLWRGERADGTVIHTPGTTFAIASADCPTTVLYDPNRKILAALHCGREALIDKNLVQTGEKGREFPSVINAATDIMMRVHQTIPMNLLGFVLAGIGPDNFEHPTVDHPYAVQNARLITHLQNEHMSFKNKVVPDPVLGKIDLFKLIKRQLAGRWVYSRNIETDGVDTATDVDTDGNYLFHSNRRDKTMRNLVLVRLN